MLEMTKAQEDAILPGLNALGATRTPENAGVVDPQIQGIIQAASRGAPGTGLTGTSAIVGGMADRRAKSEDQINAFERDYKASRDRENQFRIAQQQTLAPVGEKLKTAFGNAPTMGETVSIPQAPTQMRIDTKEMGETLSMITALAALGGALTRTPLTAALNNFSAGIQGYVTGNQKVFDNNLKEFDANLKQAKSQNDIIFQKYQAAKEKHGADIQGLQNEYKLIAAETQNPIDMELARRGDVVTLYKTAVERTNMDDKIESARLRLMEQIALHGEQSANRAAVLALGRDRLAESQRAAMEREDAARDRIRQGDDRTALRIKAAEQGGKPTQTERQHYVDSNQLLKSVDRIRGMLNNPELRAKVDDSRLAQVLSESVENKVIQQFLVRPNIDPDVKQYLNEILMLRNQYYLDQSGKAVTGGEALRNYGAVVQPGDTASDVSLKMGVASERARAKMKDYETYFPSLSVIRDKAPAAPAAAATRAVPTMNEKRVINGTPAYWDGNGWVAE